MTELATGKWQTVTDRSQRVIRHRRVDRPLPLADGDQRLVLTATAFLPIFGIKFAWLDIHWITGVGLAALILIHVVRASSGKIGATCGSADGICRRPGVASIACLAAARRCRTPASTMRRRSSTIWPSPSWCCRRSAAVC